MWQNQTPITSFAGSGKNTMIHPKMYIIGAPTRYIHALLGKRLFKSVLSRLPILNTRQYMYSMGSSMQPVRIVKTITKVELMGCDSDWPMVSSCKSFTDGRYALPSDKCELLSIGTRKYGFRQLLFQIIFDSSIISTNVHFFLKIWWKLNLVALIFPIQAQLINQYHLSFYISATNHEVILSQGFATLRVINKSYWARETQ